VLGSIGPTSRTTSVATSGEPLDESLLEEAYAEQILALSDGGVDALLIETIFDVKNAEIAIKAAKRTAPLLPIMLSFSVSTPDGHNMLGQSIIEFVSTLNKDGIFSIGINCLPDVPKMTPLVCQLASFGLKVSIYPNAGMPDGNGQYQKSPESLVADLWLLLENHCLNIVGGCCGTTDAHIRQMAKAIEPMPGLYLSPLSAKEGSPVIASQSCQFSPSRAASPARVTFDSPEERLFQAILNGKSEEAAAATREAIAQSIAPQDLINGQMIRAMGEVGQRFQDGKAFVPQLLMAGRAMKAALELLKPLLAGTAATSLGKVVIGTVKGDLHDIGKNLVASMLEGCGFEVVNIGIDVSADAFIQAVRDNQPDILCMSALLTTTMGYMKEVIDALEAAGIRNQVKVMVGGAPVTQGYADEIGADGYSDNANSAVTVAKQLLGKL
jgi:corrinoid protein of di/trimethylamine methyltransferase